MNKIKIIFMILINILSIIVISEGIYLYFYTNYSALSFPSAPVNTSGYNTINTFTNNILKSDGIVEYTYTLQGKIKSIAISDKAYELNEPNKQKFRLELLQKNGKTNVFQYNQSTNMLQVLKDGNNSNLYSLKIGDNITIKISLLIKLNSYQFTKTEINSHN